MSAINPLRIIQPVDIHRLFRMDRYCLNCDPNQPRYIRPTMAINANDDANNITNIDGMGVTEYSNGEEANNGAFNQVGNTWCVYRRPDSAEDQTNLFHTA